MWGMAPASTIMHVYLLKLVRLSRRFRHASRMWLLPLWSKSAKSARPPKLTKSPLLVDLSKGDSSATAPPGGALTPTGGGSTHSASLLVSWLDPLQQQSSPRSCPKLQLPRPSLSNSLQTAAPTGKALHHLKSPSSEFQGHAQARSRASLHPLSPTQFPSSVAPPIRGTAPARTTARGTQSSATMAITVPQAATRIQSVVLPSSCTKRALRSFRAPAKPSVPAPCPQGHHPKGALPG